MDHELCFVIEHQDDDLEQSTSGVEAESQFSCWLVVIDGVGNQVLLGSGADVVLGEPVRAERWTSTGLIVIRNANRRKRGIPHLDERAAGGRHPDVRSWSLHRGSPGATRR